MWQQQRKNVDLGKDTTKTVWHLKCKLGRIFLLKRETYKVYIASKSIKLLSFMQLQNLYRCVIYILALKFPGLTVSIKAKDKGRSGQNSNESQNFIANVTETQSFLFMKNLKLEQKNPVFLLFSKRFPQSAKVLSKFLDCEEELFFFYSYLIFCFQ